MRNNINGYVAEVMSCISADPRMKKRIEKDLLSHISELCREDENIDIVERMGEPEEVAREFMENIYTDRAEDINQLAKGYYEYKSSRSLFGLPLVHIKLSRGYGRRKACVAKGIVAIGDVSVGVVSIGAIAFGGLCLGALSLGVLGLGGVGIGLLLGIGGFAAGGLAIGGCAFGLAAMGGAAFGKIALGGFAKGVAAIGGTAVGEHVISTGGSSYPWGEVSKQQITELIKGAYPSLSNWIVKMFTIFGI